MANLGLSVLTDVMPVAAIVARCVQAMGRTIYNFAPFITEGSRPLRFVSTKVSDERHQSTESAFVNGVKPDHDFYSDSSYYH